VATFLFGRISIWVLNTLNSATPDNMVPPKSGKKTEAASSAPEARGAVNHQESKRITVKIDRTVSQSLRDDEFQFLAAATLLDSMSD
jgi:hypothetical protein